MYSPFESYILVCPRAHDPALSTSLSGSTSNLLQLKATAFLPTEEKVENLKMNLTVLVGRIICTYIECLRHLAHLIPQHIPHKFSDAMSEKSETFFLDVLLKNEAKSADMLDIMKTMHHYLGEDFPADKKVLSGGDQLTCERHCCAQRHLIDGDTARDRLELTEAVCEDWHTLMCFR